MIAYLVAYRMPTRRRNRYFRTTLRRFFFICRGYFDGFPDLLTLLAYLVSLLLRFRPSLLGGPMGMVGFWFWK